MEIACDASEHAEDIRYARVLTMAMNAGRIMLQNGAEISRVEDTMKRLAMVYDVVDCNFFVLSNGIFTTGTEVKSENRHSYAKVEHIPVKGQRLDIVDAVNQMSRDIAMHTHSLDWAESRLSEIEAMKPKPVWSQILASGLGAAAFCIIFGGSLWDAAAALIAGVVIWIFLLTVGARYLGKIVGNIAGGFLVALVCIGLRSVNIGESLQYILIGGIIPLVPGVAFVNGIRDVAEGDYLSGTVRLMDSILIFSCIAVGCVVCFSLCSLFGGGALLW